jgi:diguanylate cyclase (GGDEF)-like protein
MTEASRPVAAGRPWSSRVFDQAVAIVGGSTAVAAAVAFVATGTPIPWVYFVVVPLVALIARYPISVSRGRGALTIGLEPCVLAYLVVVLPPLAAFTVWGSAAVVAAFVATSRANRLFNGGVMLLAGAAAITLVHAVGDDEGMVPQELVAVIAGCALYFVVDLVVTEVSLTLESGRRDSSTAAPYADVVVAFLGFLGVCSLGYLTSLVDRVLPPWTMALLVVPVLTLLVASNGVSRERETARRMRVLLETSSAVQSADNPTAVLSAVDEQVQLLMQSPKAGLRDARPGPDQIGTRIRDGERVWWLVADQLRIRGATAPLSDRNALTMIGSFAEEGLARLALTRALRLQAGRDALTDLPNRNVFVGAVEDALESVRSSGDQVAVLFCDLDGFKTVNDWFGHPAGDELLVDVARRLCHAVGGQAVVARLGGDEFAILVDGEQPRTATAIAQRVLDELRPPFTVEGRELVVQGSIGIACDDGDPIPPDELVRRADVAMYVAKQHGKSQYRLFDPAMHAEVQARLALASDLGRALQQDELEVHYQPVISLDSGEIVGLEALARWNHPTLGYVSPAEFIPMAEESGLIRHIGQRVLWTACGQLRAWQEGLAGQASLAMSINLSARQFDHPALVDDVASALEDYGLDPATVTLELTESALMDTDETIHKLYRLRRLGVRLAIDDFGTGYSSLSYLRRLPVDTVKIDRALVEGVATEPRDWALLRAVLDLIHTLGLRSVAEGVERPDQMSHLRSLGCQSAQGYYFSRPLPAPAIEALLSGRDPDRGAGRNVPATGSATGTASCALPAGR